MIKAWLEYFCLSILFILIHLCFWTVKIGFERQFVVNIWRGFCLKNKWAEGLFWRTKIHVVRDPHAAHRWVLFFLLRFYCHHVIFVCGWITGKDEKLTWLRTTEKHKWKSNFCLKLQGMRQPNLAQQLNCQDLYSEPLTNMFFSRCRDSLCNQPPFSCA